MFYNGEVVTVFASDYSPGIIKLYSEDRVLPTFYGSEKLHFFKKLLQLAQNHKPCDGMDIRFDYWGDFTTEQLHKRQDMILEERRKSEIEAETNRIVEEVHQRGQVILPVPFTSLMTAREKEVARQAGCNC